MPKPKKKRAARRTVEQTPSSKAIDRDRIGRRTGFIIASVFVALISIILWISYYFSEDQRYLRLTVIEVDDTTIRMDYFLKRCQASGSDPLSMLSNLAQEEIIKLKAPAYGIEVTPEDIDWALRITASGGSGNITESEFKEWYRQYLNEIGLSNSEYRDITATSLLASHLYTYVAAGTPTIAEQIHLHTILLDTQEEAEQVRARLKAGEDFADLAMEVSLDALSRENGGDLGWLPRGVAYESRFDSEIFNLSTGNVSEPLAYYDTSVEDLTLPEAVDYYLFMVSEKADAREVDEKYLPTLMDNAFNDWLSETMGLHIIKYRGINNGFDSETYSWVNWQLSKE